MSKPTDNSFKPSDHQLTTSATDKPEEASTATCVWISRSDGREGDQYGNMRKDGSVVESPHGLNETNARSFQLNGYTAALAEFALSGTFGPQ